LEFEPAATIVEILRARAADPGDKLRVAFVELQADGHACREVTFAGLHEQAQRVASGLRSRLSKGDRLRPETEDTDRVLGLFLNTLPLRLRLPQGSWEDLIRAVFAAGLGVAAHRRYSYSQTMAVT